MRIMFVFILKQESVQFPKLNSMHSDLLSNTGAVSKSTISGLVFLRGSCVLAPTLKCNCDFALVFLTL